AELTKEVQAAQRLEEELQRESDRANSLQGGIEERDASLRELGDALTKLRQERSAFEGGVAERDARIAELTEATDRLQDVVSAAETDLAEREAGLAQLTAELSDKGDAIAYLETAKRERDQRIAAQQTEMESIAAERKALDGRVTELTREVKKSAAHASKLKKDIEALEKTHQTQTKEAEALASALRLDYEAEQERGNALQNEIKVMAERQSALQRQFDVVEDELKKSRAAAKSKQRQLTKLKKEKAATDHRLEHAEAALDSTRQALSQANLDLFNAREEVKNLSKSLDDVSRMKDMQDVTIEMEAARSKMVESELSDKIRALQDQVDFYTRAPLKAGVKTAMFRTLRGIRNSLPMPEDRRTEVARKFTGLAQRLQPSATPLGLPAPEPTVANTSIDFAFPVVENPVISIVIPVYNEISQTIACLRSIYQQQVSVSYEVILADDKSPDPFHKILETIPGLRYFRNPENLHFLLNCNRNAEHARGDYIVFLNNDTIVKPGWLQALYDTFQEHGDVGAVGSKLIFPSGELQEAGGIIWEDASGWNWGRGQNPDHPLYNYVRDVDYVSGASLMVPTKIWREIGGFYEGLEKAYYEDTDLCFRLRSMGYRVLYQPASEVIHIEGLSSGTDLGAGAKQYQVVNQDIFKTTWADALAGNLPNAQTPLIASDRYRRGHVLYVDAVTPEPKKDSGSLDAIYAMRILMEMGYRVHFVPGSNFAYWGEATRELQRMGVEAIYHPFYSNMEQLLDDRGDMFDYVVLSRPESADRFLDQIRERCPSAKIIYNTVDLHFMRMERRAETTNDPELAEAAADMKDKELGYIDRSDATIVLSSVERELLSQDEERAEKLWTIPLIRAESHRLVEYDTTSDIAFIGGYRHPPNIDAVDWLVGEIWPEMRKTLPGVRLHICGSAMPDRFADYASEDVLIRGFIPDLDELLSGLRMTIAPLRFGAGLKGKVASSIGAGVPCIGTSIAFEGMAEEGLDVIRLEAETPKRFAELAGQVYHDEALWTTISEAGVTYHNDNYAYRTVLKTYRDMLESIVRS
ncbi:MAG: glycosyltransferase, partial [Litorimonas sp.]